jgi:hypothetical protein
VRDTIGDPQRAEDERRLSRTGLHSIENGQQAAAGAASGAGKSEL